MAAGRLLCDTVSVSSRAYTYSNHVAWVLGKSLGLGLAKANAKAKTFMRCLGVLEDPRGQGQASRPGLEDNKTCHFYYHGANIP